MKQIEYTEKQKIVLEVLEQVDKEFKPDKFAMGFQRQEYFDKINRIKLFFDIREKYLTLREYISKKSCGAYHYFIFDIDNIGFKTTSVDKFEQYHNPKLLDKYYVVSDQTGELIGNIHNHHLELVKKG